MQRVSGGRGDQEQIQSLIRTLLVCSSSGSVDVVRLMISSGARLEANDVHFGPPLHIAAAKGNVGCVKELLMAGQQRPGPDQARTSGRDQKHLGTEPRTNQSPGVKWSRLKLLSCDENIENII